LATAEVLKYEHKKLTDSKVRAEAEKEYLKKLKKLPRRSVVKKHVDHRVKPLLSPLLRPSEQMFVCCAVFDVIGIMNYVERKLNVNDQIEAWGASLQETTMRPIEVMCKFWVKEKEKRKVFVFMTEYERDVAESDCIEALHILIQAGAEITDVAKELGRQVGSPDLMAILESDKKHDEEHHGKGIFKLRHSKKDKEDKVKKEKEPKVKKEKEPKEKESKEKKKFLTLKKSTKKGTPVPKDSAAKDAYQGSEEME
jgi:hypothetical protein